MSLTRLLKKRIFWKTVLYALGIYLAVFVLVVVSLRMYTHHGESFPVPDFKGLSPDRVQELASKKDLNYQILDSTFIPYLPKGSVIDQFPQPGIPIKKNRTIFLTINAFNQAKIEMPNLVGVSYRQGKTILEGKGLKVGKLIYEPDFAKNNILRQMYHGKAIKPETMIERGQMIDLVLGDGFGQSSYPIPDLIRSKHNMALNIISDSYFNVGTVNFDQTVKSYTDSLNAMVWKQRPGYYGEGRAVMGSRIDIWLTLDADKLPNPDSLPE